MTTVMKIESQRWYTMQDIIRGVMFPWARSVWSVRKAVEADRENKNVLKAIITGEGRARKYLIKGENITKFVKLVESGKVTI